nr:hypothetical protein TetV2_00172 [Oceanusvirus sp.]
MKTLVMLCLLIGGFLIMEAVSEQRVRRVKHESKKEVKYVPLSIYDEQLSGRSLRNEFTDMFYSSGPWRFRDNSYGIPRKGEKETDERLLDLTFAQLQRQRDNLAASPDEVASERRRVEERVRAQFDKLAEEKLEARLLPAEDSSTLANEGFAARAAPAMVERSTPAQRRAKREERRKYGPA